MIGKNTMTDKLKSDLISKGVEYLFCSFVELTGAPKAKLVPVTHLEEFARDGAGFAGFACGDVGQRPHNPDISSVPDFRSLAILPWRKNNRLGHGKFARRRRSLAVLSAHRAHAAT